MPKITKNVVDSNLRNIVFDDCLNEGNELAWRRINDRQFGVLLTDLNGVERYVRLGVIVAEEREDCTARELMEYEIADYNAKQKKKAEKKAEAAAKAAADKKRREEKKQKDEEEGA